jgi:aromatic-L-amino-acid decarboxylase
MKPPPVTDEFQPRAPLGDAPRAEFEAATQRALSWIADYLEHPERFPVLARTAPGEIRDALPSAPPAQGEPLDRMLEDFERTIVPGITHWNHPGFYAYFANSGTGPGILGELLTAALNVNGMLWRTSPAATELEELVLDWLRQMLGLRESWFGIICDTASLSTMLALAAAREAAGLEIRERGLAGRRELTALRVYCSEQAHSSVDKGAITLGLGHANVVKVGTDAEYRMRPDLLAAAIAEDRAAGYRPLACVATVGTTSTTSIDPVPAIADICAAEDLWLHVDGAYGGAAAVVPEMRGVLDGVDRADSLVVNPHKWLFTPVDCSALYVRRPEALRQAFSLVPEYLITAESADVVNYMDYGVQLGRRFRALKLWMVIRAFGADGLASRLREHIALARDFARWVDLAPEWERMAAVPFSTVCFRWARPGLNATEVDRRNEAILAKVNASGRAFLSHTRLHGAYTLRLAIGNLRTDRRHVEDVWALLNEAASAA